MWDVAVLSIFLKLESEFESESTLKPFESGLESIESAKIKMPKNEISIGLIMFLLIFDAYSLLVVPKKHFGWILFVFEQLFLQKGSQKRVQK